MKRESTCNACCGEEDRQFGQMLVTHSSYLKGLARQLCGNRSDAEDLIQETLTKAWRARRSFKIGTNLKAWLFTIMRNRFCTDRRRTWRQVPWNEDVFALLPGPANEAEHAVALSETVRALNGLPKPLHDAMIVVAAGGASYEEAGAICRCPEGTMKSRVARGRAALRRGEIEASRAYPRVGTAIAEILSELDRLMKPPPAPIARH